VGLPNDSPIKLFGTYENFIQYLESDTFLQKLEKPYEFLEEFLKFAKEVNTTKQFIDFNFKYPPIIAKLNNLKAKREI
jgi:hypothetical protein